MKLLFTMEYSGIVFLCHILVVFKLFATIHSQCPVGWHHFDKSCYFLSDNKYNWILAEDSCRAHNARLAEIESKEQSDYLIKAFKDFGKHHSYWIGGRDDVIEGTWQWASSNIVFNFTAWASGKPNNYHGHEDCLQMDYDHNWEWNDQPCLETEYFVCELKYPDDLQIIG
ncbi:perlucin-like isoform X1 [Mytilus trossulus]|uniref:perlucin-like isoform X1 n=1 Tax=Mytilus trossulus TaxID=6551 RepID=UPI00300481A4